MNVKQTSFLSSTESILKDRPRELNVFNFFSISVGSLRQTYDLCIFERSQTFNYTLLKYGSLLNRSLCFCFTKHRASKRPRSLFLLQLNFIFIFFYIYNCLSKYNSILFILLGVCYQFRGHGK